MNSFWNAYIYLAHVLPLSIFGAKDLTTNYRRQFSWPLDDASFFLTMANTALRRALKHWFDSEGIRAAVLGEIEDNAFLNVFGQAGVGLFAAPTVIEKEVQHQYGVKVVGRWVSLR